DPEEVVDQTLRHRPGVRPVDPLMLMIVPELDHLVAHPAHLVDESGIGALQTPMEIGGLWHVPPPHPVDIRASSGAVNTSRGAVRPPKPSRSAPRILPTRQGRDATLPRRMGAP